MSDSVHIDREGIMTKKNVDFPSAYDTAIRNLEQKFNIEGPLAEKLKAKRDFGFKKYGELSFQGSFENAMATPSTEDLLEELVDAINYLLHIQFQELFLAEKIPTASDLLQEMIAIYQKASNLNAQRTGNS